MIVEDSCMDSAEEEDREAWVMTNIFLCMGEYIDILMGGKNLVFESRIKTVCNSD